MKTFTSKRVSKENQEIVNSINRSLMGTLTLCEYFIKTLPKEQEKEIRDFLFGEVSDLEEKFEKSLAKK